MNRVRRKELARIAAKLEELEALRSEIQEELEAVMDEEQEAFDIMPESLEYSERGEQMQEYIDAMQYALDDLENLDLESIADQLGEICEA